MGLGCPSLTVMTTKAPQRDCPWREVFDGLRWLVRARDTWRPMPHVLPPWQVVYQQTQPRLRRGVFEGLVHDMRTVLRLGEALAEQPSAAIFDSRTIQSTPESRARRGYDGRAQERQRGPLFLDTLGHLLALMGKAFNNDLATICGTDAARRTKHLQAIDLMSVKL